MDIPFTARQIVRASRSGSIATLDRETGNPYVSFCSFAHDFEGNLIFLFSDLSDHTKNIMNNNRISFLCEQASHLTNPQTGPRVTLDGTVEKTNDPNDHDIFLTAHAPAKMYAGFGDFNFYKFKVESAHYVGGFGKAHWLKAAEFLCESDLAFDFYNKQSELMGVITDEFPEFPVTCATKFLKHRGKKWKIVRIDMDGIDLKLSAKIARYPFENKLKNVGDLRNIVSKLMA